jgi:hypothetical protein
LLILGLGLLFPLVHTANGWLFSFTELSPNVSWIYLPAFLRLLNVLVLGKLKGTLATLLGGMVLLGVDKQDNTLLLDAAHILSSAAGPLLALLVFEQLRGRPVNLISLADLALVTLLYCLFNSLLHHFAWAVLSAQSLSPQHMLLMALGDLTGALIGAYVLKWSVLRLSIGRTR